MAATLGPSHIYTCNLVKREAALALVDALRANASDTDELCIREFAEGVLLDTQPQSAFGLVKGPSLGSGTHGEAFAVEYTYDVNGCQYAMVIKRENLVHRDMEQKFREQTALRHALTLRNYLESTRAAAIDFALWPTPHYHYSWTCNDVVYTLMEYVAGETLQTTLAEAVHEDPAGVTPEWTLYVAQALVWCYGAAHTLDRIGIFHGDAHAANIIISQAASRATFIDFGLSEVRNVASGENFLWVLYHALARGSLPSSIATRVWNLFVPDAIRQRLRSAEGPIPSFAVDYRPGTPLLRMWGSEQVYYDMPAQRRETAALMADHARTTEWLRAAIVADDPDAPPAAVDTEGDTKMT